MNKNILTEISRIKEIMGLINEQKNNRGELVGQRKVKPYKETKEDKPYSWNGRDKGVLNFSILRGEYPLATNVGPEGYTIREHTNLPFVKKDSTESSTKPIPNVILDTFVVNGTSLPYPDNMVKPYFDKFPEALQTFGIIVEAFTKYIKMGGGNNLDNVTIQGSADSGKPTLDVPEGYGGSLDHPDSQPYGGEKDPYKMNQYLADNRANEYAKVLIQRIKEATGFDLKIKVLPGINYYGQPGKRGQEFRTITLTPNAKVLNVSKPVDSGEKPTNTLNVDQLPKNERAIVTINFGGGREQDIKGYSIVEKNGTVYPAIPYELFQKLDLPYLVGQVESELRGDSFYIENRLVGKLFPEEKHHPEFYLPMNLRWEWWTGPITSFIKRDNEARIFTREVDGQNIDLVFLIDAYYVFYTEDFEINRGKY